MYEYDDSNDAYYQLLFYLLALYAFYQYAFSYFTLKGVPVLSPSIPFGNIKKPFKPKKPRYEYFEELHARLKIRKHRHGGIYLFFKPVYMPVDLECIRNILTRDFDNFSDRGLFCNEPVDKFSVNLFSLAGQRWKEIRVKTFPIFSSKNLRNLTPTIVQTSERMLEYVDSNVDESINVQDLVHKYNLNVVANTIFGYNLNLYVDDNPFQKHVENIFNGSLYNSRKLILTILFPNLSRRLSVKVFPKDSIRYLSGAIKEIIDFRQDNRVRKNDILQSLIEANLSLQEIVAQCVLFTVFGKEINSNLMSFCLYELSKDFKTQERVRREILDVLSRHDYLTYECIAEMSYLNQVIDETMRLHPPIPTIIRKCTKDFPLPNSKEHLDKGTSVIISVLGVHTDADIYPRPREFNPDRFSEKEKANRDPFAFLPFGEGPRICPAIRFATTQIKIGLINMLKSYKFTLTDKTQPITRSKKKVVVTSKNPIMVNVVKL